MLLRFAAALSLSSNIPMAAKLLNKFRSKEEYKGPRLVVEESVKEEREMVRRSLDIFAYCENKK